MTTTCPFRKLGMKKKHTWNGSLGPTPPPPYSLLQSLERNVSYCSHPRASCHHYLRNLNWVRISIFPNPWWPPHALLGNLEWKRNTPGMGALSWEPPPPYSLLESLERNVSYFRIHSASCWWNFDWNMWQEGQFFHSSISHHPKIMHNSRSITQHGQENNWPCETVNIQVHVGQQNHRGKSSSMYHTHTHTYNSRQKHSWVQWLAVIWTQCLESHYNRVVFRLWIRSMAVGQWWAFPGN